MMNAGCASSAVATRVILPLPILTATLGSTAAPIFPTMTPTPNTTIDFEDLISNFEDAMPGPFSEGFVIPQEADKIAFQIMTLSLIDSRLGIPTELASKEGYKIESLVDQGDSMAEKSYVLLERTPVERGWGLYLFRKYGAREIVIEAPHPVADENTSVVALDLYRALQAKALLIAGTHRDANADGSSDPTHAADTIFQIVHTSLFTRAGQPDEKIVFLQIHGYSADEHPGFPQVVIGYNWKNNAEKDIRLGKIIESLRQNNISVGTCDGNKYPGLCGTLNVQRQATEGGIFIHLELSRSLRKDDSDLILALQKALTP